MKDLQINWEATFKPFDIKILRYFIVIGVEWSAEMAGEGGCKHVFPIWQFDQIEIIW